MLQGHLELLLPRVAVRMPLDDEVPCMCGTCFLMCYHGKQCNPTFMVDAPRVKMHTHSGKMESGKPPPASPPGCLDAASSDPEPAVDQSCSAHAPFVFTCAACSDWISNGSRRRPARNGDGPLSAMKPSDRQGASTARTRLLAEARWVLETRLERGMTSGGPRPRRARPPWSVEAEA